MEEKSFLWESREGISCLSSSQRGLKCRESFTNWCLTMIGRKKRGLLPCVCVCYIVSGAYLCLLLLSPANILGFFFLCSFLDPHIYILVLFCHLLFSPDQVHVG